MIANFKEYTCLPGLNCIYSLLQFLVRCIKFVSSYWIFNNKILFDFFRALFQKNDVADYEATAFSIFYNNALFLVIVVLLSFYLLKGFSTTAYPFTYYFVIVYKT